ncbi:unnamed protein product [Rotaria sp. Silwood1]|nr:unnamed protein product [Rotaria sp. Silwood1]
MSSTNHSTDEQIRFLILNEAEDKKNRNGQGYFHVEPYLVWPDGNGQVLEQEYITCQSVLSKSLGPLSEWLSRIEVRYHSGTFEELKIIIDQMAKQWKIFSITDLVYNHVANDCQLLKEHPECAYNLINSPHLKPAVLIESILIQFTRDASERKLLSKGISW